MISMKDDEFYKIDDICETFKVAKITVYRWLKDGKITGYKVGRSWLFKGEDIKNLIEKSKVVK